MYNYNRMGFKKVYLGCLFNQKNIVEITDVTAENYKNELKKLQVPAELVRGNYQVKPYFDEDFVGDFDVNFDERIKESKKVLSTLFPDKNIYVIKRTYQIDGGVKYSAHYTVDEVRMHYTNILDLLEKNNITRFDKNVYKCGKFLTSIYTNTKITKDGKKISRPSLLPDDDSDITKYLVSYVEEGFENWDLKFPKKKVTDVTDVTDVVPSLLNQISKGYEDADLIKGLVGCLSQKRADDYGDWLNVGFCLYCISPEFLPLWEEFSEKSDKYEVGVCDKAWSKMTNKNMSVGTLKFWAKLDNPKEYKKVINESLDKNLEIVLGSDGSHYDVAVITSKIMADKVVYDGKMKMWFFVNDKTNIWESDKEGVKMVQILAVDVCRVFMKASDKYGNKSFKCEPQFKLSYEEKSKKCLSIAKQLKNASFQESVKKCCKSTFMKNDFFENFIDKKEGLYACNNLIIDLDEKKFRLIEPMDYIMTTCGFDYDFDVEQNIIDEIMNILKTILPVWAVLCYLLDTLSSRLYGKNLLQLFFIWTGIGSNGKSVIGNLLDVTFGKYFGKISAESITKPNKNANSTSEFSRVSQSRIVLTEEPDEGDKLQVSVLKEHSGDSKIRTRGLFQESYEYTPQYAMIINCNEIPELSKVDGNNAIKRRLRVIHFPTKFCDNPSKPNEKLGDSLLNEKLKKDIRYRQAFLKILVDIWFSKDLKRKIDTPLAVLENSRKYIDDCNYVKRFLEECYEYNEYDEKTNPNAKIASSNLFNDFRVFCITNGIANKVDDKKFKPLVEAEGYFWKRLSNGGYYFNIVKKPVIDE